jgi:uncharacterized alpha-E superfamily protein
MSRYLERAEHSARLVDVQLNLLLEQSPEAAAASQRLLLDALAVNLGEDGPPLEDAFAVARYLTFDAKNNSIVASIIQARENASQVREQISSEMYEQLNRLYLKVRAPDIRDEWNDQPHEFFSFVKDGAHLFNGVTDGTLSHGEAWRFLQLGRSLERAGATANLLRAHSASLTSENAGSTANDYLEWVGLLKSCTSFEAYCKEYTADLRPQRIVEFLLLDEEMPRSVRHCADRIAKSLDSLAEMTTRRRDSALSRAAGKLRAQLDYAHAEDIMNTGLAGFLSTVRTGCGDIHRAIYATYIGYAVESVF